MTELNKPMTIQEVLTSELGKNYIAQANAHRFGRRQMEDHLILPPFRMTRASAKRLATKIVDSRTIQRGSQDSAYPPTDWRHYRALLVAHAQTCTCIITFKEARDISKELAEASLNGEASKIACAGVRPGVKYALADGQRGSTARTSKPRTKTQNQGIFK